jgi:alkane 1-monooxygenase
MGNSMLQGASVVAIIYLAAWCLFGWRGVLFFAAQSLVSIFLLEATNYVQHYGLVRREVSPGRYEPVAMHHAWNVEHRLTNWLLFNLGRHSEHHCEARRRYQELSARFEGPVLPLGLSGMVVLAFFPPVWQYVMDRKARHWRDYGEQVFIDHIRQRSTVTQGDSHAATLS